MTIGSDAETFRDWTAPVDSEVYGPRSYNPEAGIVPVSGLFEAAESATFEDAAGQPVYVRARYGGRLGTLVQAGHPMLKQHPDLFRPLELSVDFVAPDPARG